MQLRGESKGKDNDESSILSEVSRPQCNMFAPREGEPAKKKAKSVHFSPEIVIEIEDRKGKLRPIRALLDTGTSSSILLEKFVQRTC